MLDRPAFMENEKWYTFDFENRIFVLTETAPDSVKKSYKVYLKDLRNLHEKG